MDFFYIEKYVNNVFETNKDFDSEEVANSFMNKLKDKFTDAEFENLLIISGFIPDLYGKDSSEETLYTKLIEALVGEWARRIGAEGTLIREKASREDVRITIDKKIVVCDSKSFRLGRSQKAPNAKDFLKLEDIRKWMARYDNSLGGLVTYPCKHEWSSDSDIYQYCSTKDAPTLMLPYKYLAMLLHYRDRYASSDLLDLWNFERIFPKPLKKKEIDGGNKKAYWNAIDLLLVATFKIPLKEYRDYLHNADKLINECVKANFDRISTVRSNIIKEIKELISKEDDIEILRKAVFDNKVELETHELNDTLKHIAEFRMSEE